MMKKLSWLFISPIYGTLFHGRDQCTADLIDDMVITKKEIKKLVDRVNQLEQTVQCLSDENQTLIAKLYSKEKNNG